MGAFPTITLSREHTKVRFLEPRAPLAIGQRWLGMPRGVYFGFLPQVTSGSDVLTLATDPVTGFSLLKVGSSTMTTMVDIFTADPVQLNFTGHNVWPVYVLARADFADGAVTQARIFTRATGVSSIREVLICAVTKVGNDLVVDIGGRQGPLAFQGQRFGFMGDGAIGELNSTAAAVAEVQAARTSPYTGAHSTLKERIDADLVGASLADRLGLRFVAVGSNRHTVVGSSANVSGSFIESRRVLAPHMDLTPGGDESTEGVVCGPTDTVRNICTIVNADTGLRIIDSGTGEPVFGRLHFVSGNVGAGKQIRFFNALTSVDGNGTNPFQAPLEEGDAIQGPDGRFYEIAQIISTDMATLGSAYQGPGAPVVAVDPVYRRFTIDFHTLSGPVALASTPIQFLAPAFFRADRAVFDATLLLQKNAVRPDIEDATAATAGKALLATDFGLVGSFRTIKNASVAIGNDFHTLNFVYGGATDAGGGVVNVSVPGEVGPPGPNANQGPDGPTGPAGPGYSLNNSFELSPLSDMTAVAGGPVTLSFTVDFTNPAVTPTMTVPPGIVHLNGGWATIDGPSNSGFERLHIDHIQKISFKEGRIQGRIVPEPNLSNTRIRLFLGASQ